MKQTLKSALQILILSVLITTQVHADQENEVALAKYFQQISKDCEEYSLILAEVRVRKIDKALRAKGLSITDEQRFSIFAVTKDQCVSVKLVSLLREIRTAAPESAWKRSNSEDKINELLSRIERSLD